MIPIYHLIRTGDKPGHEREVSELPGDALCYVAAKSGMFKQIRNDFYSARIKTGGIGHLADLTEQVQLHLPKLPLEILRRAEAFFIAVYEKYESEAVVLLLANPKAREWRVEAPEQRVSSFGLHVEYEPTSIIVPEGFVLFGTIHSHAACAAFHSGTDDKDEACSDGLHITIGNLDRPLRSYAARWMIQGRKFSVELANVVDVPALPTAEAAWIEKISVAEKTLGSVWDVDRKHSRPVDDGGVGTDRHWSEEDLDGPFETVAEYEEYLREMSEDKDEEEYPIGMETF